MGRVVFDDGADFVVVFEVGAYAREVDYEGDVKVLELGFGSDAA